MSGLSLKDVLSNFDVRRYQATRDWGICEWEFALKRRRSILRDPEYYRAGFGDNDFVERFIESPTMCAPYKPEKVYDPTVTDLTNYAAWGFKEVIEASPDIAEAVKQESEGPPKFNSHLPENSEEWLIELFEHVRKHPENDLAHESFNNTLVDGPFESDTAYASVTLSAPDEIIVRDFKRWLSQIRSNADFEHSPVKQFSEVEIRRWSTTQVLPYLDLRLAEFVTGEKTSYHIIGQKLFPDIDVDVSERARKVTAPLADELMTWEVAEALKAAANAQRRATRKD